MFRVIYKVINYTKIILCVMPHLNIICIMRPLIDRGMLKLLHETQNYQLIYIKKSIKKKMYKNTKVNDDYKTFKDFVSNKISVNDK